MAQIWEDFENQLIHIPNFAFVRGHSYTKILLSMLAAHPRRVFSTNKKKTNNNNNNNRNLGKKLPNHAETGFLDVRSWNQEIFIKTGISAR